MDEVKRRSLLKLAGASTLIPGLSEAAFAFANRSASVVHEIAEPRGQADATPKHSIKFAVIGLDHNHILGITAAVQRGGGCF